MRQLVFTIPENLRSHFMGKQELNSFFKIVHTIIKRYFGCLCREKLPKRGIEKDYKLNKKVVATLHLFGREGTKYNPHINVLIFEDIAKGNRPKLSATTLNKIKKSYKRALQGLLKRKIDTVVINYKYYLQENELQRSIWYMTIPMDSAIMADLIKELNFGMIKLIIYDLLNFRHLRFWGQLANSEYKAHLPKMEE